MKKIDGFWTCLRRRRRPPSSMPGSLRRFRNVRPIWHSSVLNCKVKSLSAWQAVEKQTATPA